MAFTQTVTLQADRAEPLIDLLAGWHSDQSGVAPGYRGSRLLADLERPGRFLVEVDFDSREEAARNNDRPETQAWSDRLRGLVPEEPEFHNFEIAYTTEGR